MHNVRALFGLRSKLRLSFLMSTIKIHRQFYRIIAKEIFPVINFLVFFPAAYRNKLETRIITAPVTRQEPYCFL